MAGCGASGKPSFTQLTYHLTGGVAGFDRHLSISAKGTYQLTESGRKPQTGTLPGRQVDQLFALVRSVGWAELDPRYLDPHVADAAYEELTVQVNGRGAQVTVGTGGSAPDPLRALLDYLRGPVLQQISRP